ncbi:MAG TPA: phosphoribosyltransferase family protein [Candidatus Acidoferrum sp.]|nr:phosphoribosyltransferase family protein [Candidatus Acidoferrum sp.]
MASNLVEEPAYRDRVLVFRDRLHAGQLLADKLRPFLADRDALLLAVPAGGVAVGCAVAQRLKIPLDVAIVRKVQVPWNTEAGFGAVTWDGRVLLNEPLVVQLGLGAKAVEEGISQTREIVRQRIQKFRGNRPFPSLNGRAVVLAEDGLASGFTMLAAVESVRTKQTEKIVVAVPTASAGAIELLAPRVDELACLNIRGGPVFAVADAYEKWHDLSDNEVLVLLKRSQKDE